MTQERITADMKVWDVIRSHPETLPVFLNHGCPDMRKGIFAVSAHIMKVRWAAKMHKIPLEDLLHDLNEAAGVEGTEAEGTLH